MKPSISLLAAALLAPSAFAAELPSIDDPLRTGSKAPADAGVVIGIEDYLRAGVPDVPYASRDAQVFSDFLVSTRGVPTDRVQLIDQNANATKIRLAVTALGESVGDGGVAWVYFAGHGGASLNGGARMLLGDDISQDPESFDAGGVLVSEIEALAGAGGGRVVIVVDACYTGTGRDGQAFLTGKRTVVPGGYTAIKPKSNVVWTAASAGQTSGPLDAARHGAFTYFALGALRGWADGGIDGVRDGSVTMDEAQTYVQRTLKSSQITSQTPEVIGARDLVLSVRAKEVAPVVSGPREELASMLTNRTGESASSASTDFQAKLEAAKRAAAAQAEAEFIAAEAAKARAAKLDSAEAAMRKQATADWASAKVLVDGGGAGAKAAADAYIDAYGAAKVRVDGEERAVVIAEVEAARRVAKGAVVAAAPAPVGAPPAVGPDDFVSRTLGTMRWIPAGTFTMGSPSTESGRGDDETQHRVTLTSGYWMMEHEVTQAEYEAVMGKNPSKIVECGATCPVETVSWDDAVAFAKAASRRDKETYRLPTEAEWERAARGGRDGELYSGGNDPDAVAWYSHNSGKRTHAVCGKQRNAYGLCDMSGNVREWTSDGYAAEYGGSTTDPVGPRSGAERTARGGYWYRSAQEARVAGRVSLPPDHADRFLGFRLVRLAAPR